jgi:hypothetical protein
MNFFLKKLKTLTHILVISFSVVWLSVLFAATPNQGHPWKEVGDGWWAATGTSAYKVFVFPDATSTVLTDNDLVTIAQGGTGAGATSTALNLLSGLAAKGDIFARGVSSIGRLAVGSNGKVLTASSSQSLGVTWGSVLATPTGSNTYIQFNNGGVFGALTNFIFNKGSNTLSIDGKINLGTQSDPTPPPASTLSLYAKNVSGRSLLKAIGALGVDYAYQPSFFQNAIFMISTGAGTAYNIFGSTLTSVGTVSHVVSEALGYMANQTTGTGSNATAGTGSATTPYYVGSRVGSNGFFFQSRNAFTVATTTGTRVFIGFTDGTTAASVSADNPAGSNIGWQYSTSRGDTGWKFMTDNGTTQTVSSTIMPFAINQVFDFFIYLPPYPNNSTVYYRIDNVTLGTTAEGSTSSTLPAGTTAMRVGYQINNLSTTAKIIRTARLYVETDR